MLQNVVVLACSFKRTYQMTSFWSQDIKTKKTKLSMEDGGIPIGSVVLGRKWAPNQCLHEGRHLQLGKVLQGGIVLPDTLGAPFTTMGGTIVVEIIIASSFHIVVSFVSKAKVFHVFALPKIQEQHLSLS